MYASVVIPCYGREDKLERAIYSILNAPGSECVQIILVDDASPVLVESALLRSQDLIIRNEVNLGAAKSRNIGVAHAAGRNIYFLDSDDFFLDVNFESDVFEVGALYYCDIDTQGGASNYPEVVELASFFNFIFYSNRHIAQTSSLAFSAEHKFYFDESLPKHQDWDLVFTALLQDVPVIKRAGRIYFDRSDQLSVSRKVDHRKSDVWLRKLRSCRRVEEGELNYIFYMVVSYDRLGMSDYAFFMWSIYYCALFKITIRDVIVRIVRRYFSFLVSS